MYATAASADMPDTSHASTLAWSRSASALAISPRYWPASSGAIDATRSTIAAAAPLSSPLSSFSCMYATAASADMPDTSHASILASSCSSSGFRIFFEYRALASSGDIAPTRSTELPLGRMTPAARSLLVESGVRLLLLLAVLDVCLLPVEPGVRLLLLVDPGICSLRALSSEMDGELRWMDCDAERSSRAPLSCEAHLWDRSWVLIPPVFFKMELACWISIEGLNVNRRLGRSFDRVL